MAQKRKSYSADYKLQIVKYAAGNGNRAAGRKFGVSEKLVRDWRKAEVTLIAMKKTKRANRGLKARWPQLEARVCAWVLEQRAAGRGLSAVQLRLRAQVVAKEMNLKEFAGGTSWCYRFMQRNRLSVRARATVSPKLPADFQADADSFREFIEQHTSSTAQIVVRGEDALTQSSSPKRTSGRPFSCDACDKTFTRPTQLKQHARTHTGEKPYTCEQCGKRFALSSSLRRHKRTHTGERPYQCDRCDRDFTRAQNLKQHLRVQHNVFSSQSEDRRFSCQFCDKIFSFAFDLKRHIRSHTGERPYSCEQCGKSFTLASTLIQHKRVHSGERPYECDKCGKKFTQLSSHNYHQRNCHTEKKPNTCEYCKKAFKRSRIKRECSCRKRTLLVPSTCQFCGKTFTRANDLPKTTQSHAGEGPDSCEECGRRFTLSTTLLGHNGLHTVVRFKCDQCGRTFSKCHHLKHHLRNFHKDDRPFVCQLCKKTFTQSSALDYHKCARGKTRPYSCDQCKKSFTRPYLLKMHQRGHTGSNLYRCERCKMVFTTAFSLTTHRRRCGKRFSHKGALQTRHRLISQSPTKSSVCGLGGRTFTGPPAPKTRPLIHNDDNRPYKCDYCERSFAQTRGLKVHVRRHLRQPKHPRFITEDKSRRHRVPRVVEAAEARGVRRGDLSRAQESDGAYGAEVDSFQVEVELETACEVCSKTFNTKDQYYEHLRNHEIELIVI